MRAPTLTLSGEEVGDGDLHADMHDGRGRAGRLGHLLRVSNRLLLRGKLLQHLK